MTLNCDDFQELSWDLLSLYDSPVRYGRHLLDFTDICYACWFLKSGTVDLQTENDSFQAGPGDWVLNGVDKARTQRFSGDAQIISIRFHVSATEHPLFHIAHLPVLIPGDKEPSLLQAAQAMLATVSADGYQFSSQSLQWRQQDREMASWALLQGQFMIFIAHWLQAIQRAGALLSRPPVVDQRLAEVIQFLRDDIGVDPVPYEQLSELSGLSRVQLDRLLPRYLGMSASAYRAQRCLESAQQDLRQAKMPIKEIASSLRFTDSSHFAKWFKKRTGLTPRQWQRQPADV